MGAPTRLRRLKLNANIPGASTFNDWVDGFIDIVESLCNPSATGIATVTSVLGRTCINVPAFPIGIGKTTSSLSGRIGTVAGTGNAALQLISFVGGVVGFIADASRTNVVVYNFSASSGLSGKYFVWLKIGGFYFVVSMEC